MPPKKRFRFLPDPIAVVFFAGILFSDRSGLFPAVALAAGFHEAGHLLAAKAMKIPMAGMRLDLLGARLETRGRLLSYGEEWLLCAAGPLFSLLLAVLPFPLWEGSAFARQISGASALLGCLNLLPIRTFDGGRMLSDFLSAAAGERCAEKALDVTSFCCLFLLWSASVYCLLRVGSGLSLLAFSMSLFLRFFHSG